MKQLGKTLKPYALWLILLLSIDGFAVLLLWLSDVKAFKTLIGLIMLLSLVLFTTILIFINLKEQKRQKLFRNFISNPDDVNEEKLFQAVSGLEREQLQHLSAVLRENHAQLQRLNEDLRDYEEYVEGWAHEAKTPLSLLTMILDNRSDEIPPNIHAKLDYVRSQFQDDITQMLYYARLKSTTKDYRFEYVNLQDLFEEVLEDYAPLLSEKGFAIYNKLEEESVFTDRRGLRFMLSQIVSNSVKYSNTNPILVISLSHSENEDVLSVGDNGIGVKNYDLPYIFQKGFTGDSTDSGKKATGMGLYLTKKMADDLNLKLDAKSKYKEGFSISIAFPRVNEH